MSLPTFSELLDEKTKEVIVDKHNFKLTDGDVVIAAITSCTNTSNPNVLVAAGLVAKKANDPRPSCQTMG